MQLLKKSFRIIWRTLDLVCGVALLIYGVYRVLSPATETCLGGGVACEVNLVDILIPWALIAAGCLVVLFWWFAKIRRKDDREVKYGVKPEDVVK